ncbi:hydroxycinnamoyl-CoA:piscidic acid hydroxycinnamoyltransferase-like [Cornus florida]|uniref:hydroxycinnamoyl-CoA:piscidic acid hydroxycinnamoyltransferase-like n=1 Tax=Cornus florida TaxID=4283 RepID=UPI00289B689C|nr:hydroxycinnamoyl-CoA:piscidic acid hydroxycinnamoyltransferase-like [Cornus florida]XP_059637688.1 hydroxycinnamoyl-CoA:piscidic acid hydroxycinnamoyltransferase-like [Cornus florida]
MVSLKGSYMVKPLEQTPNSLMDLSDCDQIQAITHAPTVYFYRPASKFDYTTPIDILRDSLSKALVIFYPLAGRLHWIDSAGRLELHCNSMGALLLEAESEAKIDDFGDFCPTPQIRALVPSVDYSSPIHEQPLVLVQLTKFSCGGISIGLGISHVLIDGPSAFHFVTEWAKIARGEQSDNPPFLDRSVLLAKVPLAPPSFDHVELNPTPLLIGRSDNLEERKKETMVVMLKLSKDQIDKLKKIANEGKSRDRNGGGYSRYEAVAGHMWRCACRARKLGSQQQTRLDVAINFRNRLDLPKGYFGNAIARTAAIGMSGEIVSKPLSYTSSKIREAIDKMTGEYVISHLAFVKSQNDMSRYRNFHTLGCTKGAFYGNPNVEITSWASLPLYGADFGWGKEIHMGPAAMGYDGKSFILPGHDDDGSFTIPLRLQVAHMDAFRKFFYEDI